MTRILNLYVNMASVLWPLSILALLTEVAADRQSAFRIWQFLFLQILSLLVGCHLLALPRLKRRKETPSGQLL